MATSKHGEIKDWTDAQLWRKIEHSSSVQADASQLLLKSIMPKIQSVLASGLTSPQDFTLHDAQHAFRVAERMVEILPDSSINALSPYELTLLLLSAYLHDIGMTPERRRVASHHNYLTTGQVNDLSKDEIEAFQEWLDDEGGGIVPPLFTDIPTVETAELAHKLVAHYCRHRHNDWSELWIREHLKGLTLGSYRAWLDDLVTLCKSHHYGYERLKASEFDPIIAESDVSTIVNIRFLAVVLRVADILEFDPERTPEILFKHRAVAPESRIYWWKDHEISYVISEEGQLTCSARPRSAAIHRAIELMVEDIERELQLARRLDNEIQFNRAPGLKRDLPHVWWLQPFVHRSLAPYNQAYEYIDGSFRPNTQKLLELLSGIELYGTPFAAVRELLQNSFDAVRELMAYECLAQRNQEPQSLIQLLGQMHSVRLEFVVENGRAYLVCADDGIGMTQAIIKNYLLVSGLSTRHDILALERKCREKNFPLGRTGRFGIGVLSYFMLAERVEILTRRHQAAGDVEESGWHFETEGVGSFGELRKMKLHPGTTVKLELRERGTGSSWADWYEELIKYLRQALVYLPCPLSLTSNLENAQSLNLCQGWNRTYSTNQLFYLSYDFREEKAEFTPATELERREERLSQIRLWQIQSQSALRWQKIEGDLPSCLGKYRILIPYFELPGGSCLGFLCATSSEDAIALERHGEGFLFLPSYFQAYSWKGMNSRSETNVFKRECPAIIEIDWLSDEAGTISTNRNTLILSHIAKEACAQIENIAWDEVHKFIDTNSHSIYSAINYRVFKRRVSPKNKADLWPVTLGDKTTLRPITLPATTSLVYKYSRVPQELQFRGERLNVYSSISDAGYSRYGQRDHYQGLAWAHASFPPTKVGLTDRHGGSLLPLWTTDFNEQGSKRYWIECEFPPGWERLLAASFEFNFPRDQYIWNPANPVVKNFVDDGARWSMEEFRKSIDPALYRDKLLSDRAYGAAWFALCCTRLSFHEWCGLYEREAEFMANLMQVLHKAKQDQPPEVFLWRHNDVEPYVLHVTGVSCDKLAAEKLFTYFEDPGMEWRVLSVKGSSRVKNLS